MGRAIERLVERGPVWEELLEERNPATDYVLPEAPHAMGRVIRQGRVDAWVEAAGLGAFWSKETWACCRQNQLERLISREVGQIVGQCY